MWWRRSEQERAQTRRDRDEAPRAERMPFAGDRYQSNRGATDDGARRDFRDPRTGGDVTLQERYDYDQDRYAVPPGTHATSRLEGDTPLLAKRTLNAPKGYRRSDARIHEDVCERLGHEDALDARDIEVSVRDGEVMLSGTVPDRRMKWLAEELASCVRGVDDVRNELRVARAPW